MYRLARILGVACLVLACAASAASGLAAPGGAPQATNPEYAKLLTPADVQKVTGLQVKMVPYDPKSGAGGDLNFALEDGAEHGAVAGARQDRGHAAPVKLRLEPPGPGERLRRIPQGGSRAGAAALGSRPRYFSICLSICSSSFFAFSASGELGAIWRNFVRSALILAIRAIRSGSLGSFCALTRSTRTTAR